MAERLTVASIDRLTGGHLGDAARPEYVWQELVAAA